MGRPALLAVLSFFISVYKPCPLPRGLTDGVLPSTSGGVGQVLLWATDKLAHSQYPFVSNQWSLPST